MANADRPNGLRPVKTLSGAPMTGMIKYVPVADSDNLFIGDLFNLESGLADVAATDDAALLGVCVGFGKVDGKGIPQGPYNPDNLMERYYNDGSNTHTDWVAYYVPVIDVVFEAQTASALTFAIGATCDLVDATGGNTTTGISTMELTSSTNADFTVVEIPKYVDNDHTLANGRYWVMVTRAEQALHA